MANDPAETPDAGTHRSEVDPLLVDPNPQIKIDIEKKDLSVGKARYHGAKPVSKNLTLKPTLPGYAPNPICHSNIEVHLYDAKGNEVPMTRRLVRHWYIKPSKDAKVDNLRHWRIVGLQHRDYLPFSPHPSSLKESPASRTFEKDGLSTQDAPGVQSKSQYEGPFGQLQEFLVGNAAVGGAYYQVYSLTDENACRVLSTDAIKLSAKEYREKLHEIDTGEHAKTKRHKLLYEPISGVDSTTTYPRRVPILNPPQR